MPEVKLYSDFRELLARGVHPNWAMALGNTRKGAGRRSEESLYRFELATYDTGDVFDQSLAKGFIDLWGLPAKVWNQARKRNKR